MGVGVLWLTTPVNDSSGGMFLQLEKAGPRLVGAPCTTNKTKKVKRYEGPGGRRTETVTTANFLRRKQAGKVDWWT
jgi:hypothetical protein